MPASTACPVSEVDRALSVYIHSRQDVMRIRGAISKYLSSTARIPESPLQYQHLDLECPHNVALPSTEPKGVAGIRAQYLRAFQAKLQAQAKHRELQSLLEDLRRDHTLEQSAQSMQSCDNEAVEGHVTLLRQRHRVAELQVIQDSLEKLMSSSPVGGHQDYKMLVKDVIGEQPDLPAERLEQTSHTHDNESGIFKLKRDVLEAKRRMDRATASRSNAQNESLKNPSLQQQVHALENARDEIVQWVEEELAKLNEDSVLMEDASPIKKSQGYDISQQTAPSEDRIRKIYDQYTVSRSLIVAAQESFQRSPVTKDTGDQVSQQARTGNEPVVQPKAHQPINNFLAHLPDLVRISTIERALLQQAVYLQSKITATDEDMLESLSKLADESHLLPSGARGHLAWGQAAERADAANQVAVRNLLEDSRQQIDRTNTITDLCSLQSQVLNAI